MPTRSADADISDRDIAWPGVLPLPRGIADCDLTISTIATWLSAGVLPLPRVMATADADRPISVIDISQYCIAWDLCLEYTPPASNPTRGSDHQRSLIGGAFRPTLSPPLCLMQCDFPL